MDDTNLRYNNLVANESKQLYDVTFTEGKILRIQISIMMKNLNLYQDMIVYIYKIQSISIMIYVLIKNMKYSRVNIVYLVVYQTIMV